MNARTVYQKKSALIGQEKVNYEVSKDYRPYSKRHHTNFLFGGLLYFRVLLPTAIEILKIDIEANKQDIEAKLPGSVITAKKQ